MAMPLRVFAESQHYCNLKLSPSMAAIMDASEGRRPDTIDDRTSIQLFGCPLDSLPSPCPNEVGIRAGGRGGKSSRLLAVKAIHSAIYTPAPTLMRGELARVLIVAPEMDLARQVLSYIKGYIAGSPALRQIAEAVGPGRKSGDTIDDDEEPEDVGTSERVLIRRPNGQLAEIRIRAARRGGMTARSRTLLALLMDEVCFFYAGDGYTVTDQAIYDAGIQRLVPEGQVWLASTPWLEGEGVLEKAIARNWGTHEDALVCVAPTRRLNPTWDQGGALERKMRAIDPENADREILAIPLRRGADHLYDRGSIGRALTLTAPDRPPDVVGVGGDAGFVSDGSGLGVVGRWDTKDERPFYAALHASQVLPLPGEPLKPSEVVGGWAVELKRWPGIPLMVDSFSRESIREHADAVGIQLSEAPSSPAGPHLELRKALDEGRFALGDLPSEAREMVRYQLGQVKRKVTPGGGMSIVMPRRKIVAVGGGGGHCDAVAALVLGHWSAHLAMAEGDWMRVKVPRRGAVGICRR